MRTPEDDNQHRRDTKNHPSQDTGNLNQTYMRCHALLASMSPQQGGTGAGKPTTVTASGMGKTLKGRAEIF